MTEIDCTHEINSTKRHEPAAPLPVAERWFRTRRVETTLTRIDEPHVNELLRANIWWVKGRDRDLVVDTGLGVASLRKHLPQLFARDPLVVLTHSHLDHMGGAYEFDFCAAHPGDPFRDPPPGSLNGPAVLDELGITSDLRETVPPVLVNAIPHSGYDVGDYRLRPARITRWLRDGDHIDVGDRQFTVLHLPGHSPSSIGLFDQHTGTLFSGDVIYDDVLIDDCIGADRTVYRNTMQTLIDLDARTVHAGHGDSFNGARLHQLAADYLEPGTH
ncbi:MAG: MBL fold metallo-hydrolase [Rhodococcus sp. (in: high G+C Gram-positive bacteria)]